MKIGLIGCGAIGRTIAVAMDHTEAITAIFLFDRSEESARSLATRLEKAVHVNSIEVLINNCELVVEAASQAAVQEFAPQVLWAGRDLLLMSVGALADDKLADHLRRIAREKRCRIYIPTGAIAGVDGVRCAAEGRIDEVSLETRKPPRALVGNDTVERMGIDLDNLKEEVVLFDGTARRAGGGASCGRCCARALPARRSRQSPTVCPREHGEATTWRSSPPRPARPSSSTAPMAARTVPFGLRPTGASRPQACSCGSTADRSVRTSPRKVSPRSTRVGSREAGSRLPSGCPPSRAQSAPSPR